MTSGSANAGTVWWIARALAHRNYRLYFAGQGVSMIGTWMSRVATGWLVFRLAGDHPALLLGVVGFVGQSPTFFLAPIAGALVDRWDRHRVLVITQALSAVQSLLLALVAFTATPGLFGVTQVAALSFLQGVLNAFDMPARQSFLTQLVARREDLPNAVALNSSLVNGARLVGPALAGVLIALTGEAWCFLLDAVSYGGVIASLLLMDVPAREPRGPAGVAVWAGVLEGFRYAFGFAPVRALLLLSALVSLAATPYTVLMPVFAEDVLGGGPSALGLLTAASGAGALAGALYLASRRNVLGLGRVIVLCTGLFGLALIGFALSRSLWLSLLLMPLVGFGMMVQMAASNTILQTVTDEDKRGRVMSLFSMAFMGMAPFGSLLAGWLSRAGGVGLPVLVGGLTCLAGAAGFAFHLPHLRRETRPHYVRLGILPEVASGLAAATSLDRLPPS